MLNYTLTLTQEESAFAEEHHDLIYCYLRFNRLPADDFYDIAVFGYLRAVRKYLARPELRQQYKFSTIAFRAMSCDVHHSREYWNRAKRRGETLPYNEDRDGCDFRDTVVETMTAAVDFERLVNQITPTQRRIASLRADGYNDREIAGICKIERADVTAEMEAAKCRILAFRSDAADLAA